jgi:hypothetical protein
MRLSKAHFARIAILVPLALVIGRISAQAPEKHADIVQELIGIETGFFEAWKSNDQAYFRSHMPENGISWGEDGTLSRDQQLEGMTSSAKACSVEGYRLSDFGVLPLATGAYLLTYKAEQFVTCGGARLPVHMNGSSVYVRKEGRWQAVYRAEVALKNQA